MRAAIYKKYGPPDVVSIDEVAKPVPRHNEILIKIIATTVSAGDARLRSLDVPRGFRALMRLMFGALGPRQPILGTELAGIVEATGREVTKFRIGEEVFASPDIGLACHAEYRTMPEDGEVLVKPANFTFEEAAAICFGGTTALYFLRDLAKIREGEKLLVIGASGAVGSTAVQLAKHFGAQVTGVCSTANIDLVTSIGADQVIDYTKDELFEDGQTYDIILDTVGAMSFRKCRNALAPNGRLLLIAADLFQMLGSGLFGSKTDGKKIITGMAPVRLKDLQFLKDLCESGAYKPVIDQILPLERIVEAHTHVDSGHKRGSIVIQITTSRAHRRKY